MNGAMSGDKITNMTTLKPTTHYWVTAEQLSIIETVVRRDKTRPPEIFITLMDSIRSKQQLQEDHPFGLVTQAKRE
jgi:hypothetical protein